VGAMHGGMVHETKLNETRILSTTNQELKRLGRANDVVPDTHLYDAKAKKEMGHAVACVPAMKVYGVTITGNLI
tara:strand:+ start:3011 stop:3232 length:222 start_codon:yes stop_codon:yes gene_type:complete